MHAGILCNREHLGHVIWLCGAKRYDTVSGKSKPEPRRTGCRIMWEAVGKYVGGKVLTAILVVASAGSIIWFWRHPEQLQEIWSVLKAVLAWLGFALILPWALFFVVRWVRKFENNLAPALMLLAYLTLDVLAALYLAGWHVSGALTWVIMVLGFLAVGVYNFLVCETLDSRIEASEGL